jgi:blocked-early-in-transport protein 1
LKQTSSPPPLNKNLNTTVFWKEFNIFSLALRLISPYLAFYVCVYICGEETNDNMSDAYERERQNNSRLSELSAKVSALRGVTVDIYDNARQQDVIDNTVCPHPLH